MSCPKWRKEFARNWDDGTQTIYADWCMLYSNFCMYIKTLHRNDTIKDFDNSNDCPYGKLANENIELKKANEQLRLENVKLQEKIDELGEKIDELGTKALSIVFGGDLI